MSVALAVSGVLSFVFGTLMLVGYAGSVRKRLVKWWKGC